MSRLSLLSARRAAQQTEASLVAESVLAEVESGAVELVELAGEWNPTETQTPEWRYETSVEPTQMQGMLMVRVVVAEIDPGDEAPTTFQLVRWLPDPEYLELIQSQSEEAL